MTYVAERGEMNVRSETVMQDSHFRLLDQLNGFSESCSPSQSIILAPSSASSSFSSNVSSSAKIVGIVETLSVTGSVLLDSSASMEV